MNIEQYLAFVYECQRCRSEGVTWNALMSDVVAARTIHNHTDFQGINLSGEEVSDANLYGAHFDNATLINTMFYSCDLQQCTFAGANLSGATLSRSNLRYARFDGANLSRAMFYSATLYHTQFDLSNASSADFSHVIAHESSFVKANLSYANFNVARLIECKLTDANLTDANLSKASLTGSNLSGAQGIPSAEDFLRANFQFDDEGVIVYKQIGLQNQPPDYWKIEPGSVLLENVCMDRTISCGCGVNVATKYWLRRHGEYLETWECVIPYAALSDVAVPYESDGKIRARKVILRRIISQEELYDVI